MAYFDCYLIPVPASKLSSYKHFSRKMAQIYREHGALRQVDCQFDPHTADGSEFHAQDVRNNLIGIAMRDFPMAAACHPDEVVIVSWTEWPDKQSRDAGLAAVLADPRVQPQPGEAAIFDGRRLIAGGFTTLVDE